MGITLNRLAVILIVVVLVRGALSALMIGNVLVLLVCAIGAAAFACNWPLDVSRSIRIGAFIVQVLTVVAMAGMLFLLLSIAEAGTTVGAEMPWWAWLGIGAVAFIAYRAVSQGYLLLKDDSEYRGV